MENAFIIKGGNKLKGSIKLSGAKNAALKIIIAALMFKNKVTIKNVPRIKDVEELIHLLTTLGAEVDFHDRHTLEIDGKGLKSNKVDLLHASKIRVSFMLFAPLLHKFSTCYVPNPGGCRIGARPIDRIIDGMKSLGIRIEYDSDTGFYYAQVKSKIQGYYKYPKVTHTGTELLIMLSVLGDDKVILDNTALEPEIDDLIRFLNLAGARIKQLGKKITILPVKELKQKDAFEINSDRNEAVTYASIATASKGEIMLSPIQPEILKTFTAKMKQIGAEVENIGKSLIRFGYAGPLKASSVQTSPHPGFMTDWQPCWAILMTQAKGESVIHERVFENRFSYVTELRKLGADIDFVKIPVKNPAEYFFFNFSPDKKYHQAIRIRGPQDLHGGVLNVADLRAGATLATAALIAGGESVINGASIIERGYENFVEKVRSLGGEIKKL